MRLMGKVNPEEVGGEVLSVSFSFADVDDDS